MPNRLAIVEVAANRVRLQGEIDAHSASKLAERFQTLPDGVDDIVIDMGGVTFMDSSGLRVLIDLHRRADAESRRLVLDAPSQSVVRLLEVSGLADHFSTGRDAGDRRELI